MPRNAFLVGPYESGFVNAVKPYALPEDAFNRMENAYVWRGHVKKRFGSRLFTSTAGVAYEHLNSRLRVALTNAGTGAAVVTDGTGAAADTVPGAKFNVGQMFSIGTTLYTVYQNGAMHKTDGTTTATFNTGTGAFVFAGAPINTQVYWYPADPVMGITQYEATDINDEPTFAFDTQFAYQRAGGAWSRLGAGIWTGSDSQFFWATNYRGAANDDYYLFVVNNNRADGISYWTGAAWATITPQTALNVANAVNYVLESARLIIAFKDRLIALNTIETVDDGAANPIDVIYPQRARWCRNGDPTTPIGANGSWYDDIPGRGGWIDAPTKEAIITARILKDRLLVYFERSTWELVYTGNQVLPFVWQTIDAELGAESTFSSILLDRTVLGVGQSGIHQSDGLHVSRIDDKIPQEVFKIHNDNVGVERVAGVRDYNTEMAYWAFPDATYGGTYPNRVLVYNYKNNSWSFNDDAITAFGYYQNVDDMTWGTCPYTWEEFDRLWRSGLNQSLTRNVLAGNQEGFTFIIDSTKNSNAAALQITDMDITVLPLINLTVINHNLRQGDYVLIEFVQGITNVNDVIYEVVSADASVPNTLTVRSTPDITTAAGAYTGGGMISRVSKIDLLTKQFNFYKSDVRMAIDKVIFDVDKSSAGQLYVNFFTSTSSENMATTAVANGTAVGSYDLDTSPYALYPQEDAQNRLVRPVYLQAEGDCIQLQLTFTESQMYDLDNMRSAFELNSMTFYATPTSTRY